ncbi:MAG TPA: AraC family transcriptional regulator [Puia sp.]|jgi:AraC-like DNA-binding protein
MKTTTDKMIAIAGKVRDLIFDMIYNSLELPDINYSTYISRNLCINYTTISKSFSKAVGVTIERYIIDQKIERVKEMLSVDHLKLSEIAWKLGYSSVAHLSGQFKKITGITPSVFRKTADVSRFTTLQK